MTNLNQSIRDYDDSIEKSKIVYSGILGLAIGGSRKVNIETRAGYVYVRLRDSLSEVVHAYNDKVSPVYDFPVLLERRGNKWYITGRDDQRYETFGTAAPFLPQHGGQHSLNRDGGGGGDPVFVYPDQFVPLLVYPSGTFGAGNLMVAPYALQRTSDFIYVGNTGTPNLLVYKPTNSQAIMGLVYLDKTTGNPGLLIASGTPLAGTITGTASVLPYLPFPSSNQEPLYAFRLVSGTTAVDWDSLYNVRQFYGGPSASTGTSGGGTPGGSDTHVQINASGTFSGSNKNTFSATTGVATLGTPDSSGATAHRDESDESQSASRTMWSWGDSFTSFLKAVKALGTKASPSAVTTGTPLGRIRFAGYDGVTSPLNATSNVEIRGVAAENFTSGSHGAGLQIFVTPTGTVALETTPSFEFTPGGNIELKANKEYHVNGVQHTHDGENVNIDASGFSGNLDSSVTDVQLLADAVDEALAMLLTTHGQGTNVPAGATRYMLPGMVQTQVSPYSLPFPAGTFKNLFVRQAGAQPGGGSMTFKLYAGPVGSLVDTGIGVTFAAGSAGQDRTDTTHTYTHTSGEHIFFVLVNNDGSAASANIGGVTIEFRK